MQKQKLLRPSTETEPDTDYAESDDLDAQDDVSSEPDDADCQLASDTDSVETEEDSGI